MIETQMRAQNTFPEVPEATVSLTLPNGLKFHLPSKMMRKAAKFLVREIFKNRRYCREGFEIGRADTIVDVGANMGLFVMWAAPQAPEGRIVAVEPTDAIDVLNTNLKRNNIRNVSTIRAAVGSDEGFTEIVTYPRFNVISHQRASTPTFFTRALVSLWTGRWKQHDSVTVAPTVSLGRIMEENRLKDIDLLKIDGEGCEFTIFRNIAVKHLARIRRIAMEFHEYHPDNRCEELVSILEGSGYQVAVVKPLFDYYAVGRCGFIWAWRNGA